MGDRGYLEMAYPEDAPGFGIDFRQIYIILRRNIWLIVGVIFLALVLGFIGTLLMTPKYVATASVQIDQEADKILSSDDVQPSSAYQDADRFLQTQTDVLRSRSMAIRVTQELGLSGDPKFLAAMKVQVPPAVDDVRRQRALRDLTINLVQNNLDVVLPRDSRVVKISFTSPDPELAAKLANTYATSFITNNLQRKYESSSYARSFLGKQLAEAKTRLEQSERDLNDYAREAGLIKTSDPNPGGMSGPRSVTTASLIQLNQAANAAKADRIAAEQKWREVEGVPLLNIPDVLANGTVQSLLQQKATKTAELMDERARHRDDYPSIQQTKAQIAELTSQITAIASSIRSSIRGQYEVALRQEQSLDSQVSSLKGETLSEQDRGVRYNILSREADTNRTLYDGLLQRYKEVSAAAGVSSNNISVIDEAEVPGSPSSPKLFLNLALSILAGMVLAAIIVFVREQIDDAVRVPEDIERKLGLGVLGVIPRSEGEETLKQQLDSPRSVISEAYYALRTALSYSTPRGLPRSLLITSSQPSEGKTTSSYAIATNFARLGLRVVLIDADMRRPSLHTLLGMKNDIGLSTILTRQSDLPDATKATAEPNLAFVPSGPIPTSPTDLLGGPVMAEILHELTNHFDLIVIDGPPVLGLADAPIVAALVEATIFIVESNRGHRGATKGAVRRLRGAHISLIGAVLTKFDPKKTGDTQYYGYNYYTYGSNARLIGSGE
ncbi:hypothetical protein GCM10009087_26500 [Sphingomonas oligophenolica]|uniref:non-specific protein-tyrosine kinase n=1 Tax=Sphingomonas oligophenolica TaxID=301154 RepID=A0ABU9YCU1_9SPHN